MRYSWGWEGGGGMPPRDYICEYRCLAVLINKGYAETVMNALKWQRWMFSLQLNIGRIIINLTNIGNHKEIINGKDKSTT